MVLEKSSVSQNLSQLSTSLGKKGLGRQYFLTITAADIWSQSPATGQGSELHSKRCLKSSSDRLLPADIDLVTKAPVCTGRVLG